MNTSLPHDEDLGSGVARPVDDGQRSGLPLLPTQAPGACIDLELVNQLRDDEC